ncbi:MAG TPA: hypothetical protein VJJ52_07645, partial [Candidatus Nanoarchaeia archaeon]|nr:hypothetical protein [Candidatus Nanoarchaeia archaeon]
MSEIKTPVQMSAIELAEYLLTFYSKDDLDKVGVGTTTKGNSNGQQINVLTVGSRDYRMHGGFLFFEIMVGDGTPKIETMSDRFSIKINYDIPSERRAEFDPSEFDKRVLEATAA